MGLRFVMEEEDDERYVFWMERRGRGTFLQATPIDVSNILAETPLRQGGYHRPDVGHAGRRGRLRLCGEAAGRRRRPHADCPRPFRLPEAGAALRAAAPARSAQPGIHEARRRRGLTHSRTQPRARLRALHQLPADAPGVRRGLVRPRISHAAAGHGPAQRAARRVPLHARLRPVRHVVLLAGRGRAGRTVELRYHR